MTQFNWLKAQQGAPSPSLEGGATGYFSEPQDRLDPSLFDGSGHVHANVRSLLTGRIISFMHNELRLKNSEEWLHVWLAGSGITYQWAGDRGNGDLDVLLGINRTSFDSANPDHAGLGEADLATWIDAALRSRLWPTMAETQIGGRRYEVTFFYNAGTGNDIRNINPYAAYDLTEDKWTVRPPAETAATHKFPQEWFASAALDAGHAQKLVRNYHAAYTELATSATNSPGFQNAGSKLNAITAEARAFLDDIHHGRRQAFQSGGEGYLSWPNFRWQEAKGSGTIKALSEISGVRALAEEDLEKKLYGSTLPSADDLLIRAMLGRKA